MSEERTEKIARNEALYRQVNERIEDLNDMFGEMSGEFFVVCAPATRAAGPGDRPAGLTVSSSARVSAPHPLTLDRPRDRGRRRAERRSACSAHRVSHCPLVAQTSQTVKLNVEGHGLGAVHVAQLEVQNQPGEKV
jgi:hypothetical protein